MPNQHLLTEKFQSAFKTNPQIFIYAPGRINIIGEHTDYNMGLVMPCAIEKYIFMAIAVSTTPDIEIFSIDFNEYYSCLPGDSHPTPAHWANYILGVIYEWRKIQPDIPGLKITFFGNIPIGAGLSSSAALECATVFGLNQLLKGKLSKLEMAKLAQKAEQTFSGVECGIMDQFASLFGKENNAILLNCENLNYSEIPIELENHTFLLCQSKVKHQLAESEYNTRKRECETGLAILKYAVPTLPNLSHATEKDIQLHLVGQANEKIVNRCKYVIEENQRVKYAVNAIKDRNWELLGCLLFQSHNGLRDLYEVSCRELDFLVSLAESSSEVLGARMMGGGFGGCTLNLIHKNNVQSFISKTNESYFLAFGIQPEWFLVNPSSGVNCQFSQ